MYNKKEGRDAEFQDIPEGDSTGKAEAWMVPVSLVSNCQKGIHMNRRTLLLDWV